MKIRTFEQTLGKDLTAKEIEIKKFLVPQAIPRNSGRTYNARHRDIVVASLYEMLQENEVLAATGKPLTNDQLRDKLLMKYKHNQTLRRRFKTYKETIGQYRKLHNLGQLYASQPPTYILSFQYDEHGYIVVGGYSPRTYMYFEDCYQRCLQFKVCDPRFVPYEYIVEIRNRQLQNETEWLEWVVPNDDEIKKFATRCKVKNIYNSLDFLPGWKREDTPSNYEPCESIR